MGYGHWELGYGNWRLGWRWMVKLEEHRSGKKPFFYFWKMDWIGAYIRRNGATWFFLHLLSKRWIYLRISTSYPYSRRDGGDVLPAFQPVGDHHRRYIQARKCADIPSGFHPPLTLLSLTHACMHAYIILRSKLIHRLSVVCFVVAYMHVEGCPN